MNRLRTILAAAAVAFVAAAGALLLPDAIDQAATDDGLNCKRWRERVQGLADNTETWFVLVPDAYVPPEAFGDRVIGEKIGPAPAGRYRITRTGCRGRYAYDHQRSGLRGPWRILRFDGARYFARSWQLLADQDAAIEYLHSWKRVTETCELHATANRCRTLLGDVTTCWKLPGGSYCRDGLEYGPGLGGVLADNTTPATCSPGVGSVPYPCGDRGRGPQWAERRIAEDLDVSVD